MVRYILLNIYETARCEDFKTFIQTKKDTKLPNLMELMQESEDKYRDLMKSGKWSQTPKDELILALQAKTKQLTKENKALAKSKRKKKEKKSDKRTNKAKRRKISNKQEHRTKDREWMTIPPKEGKDEDIITREGKEWALCTFHKKWVVYKSRFGTHTSKTCRLNPNNNSNKDKKSNKPKVKINAHQAQSEAESGYEESTSSSESESDESQN